MIRSNIKSYTNGWFIGDFVPTLFKTPAFEIAHHFYRKGFVGVPHTHKICTEFNYIVSGRLVVSGVEMCEGDIFVYEPNEVSDVIYLADTNLIVIKSPSIPTDKYIASS